MIADARRLEEWAGDAHCHVRRLVSEGTRPRLPLAPRLSAFVSDPWPVLAQIGQLQEALWAHAIRTPSFPGEGAAIVQLSLELGPPASLEPPPLQRQKRAYHRKAPKEARYAVALLEHIHLQANAPQLA